MYNVYHALCNACCSDFLVSDKNIDKWQWHTNLHETVTERRSLPWRRFPPWGRSGRRWSCRICPPGCRADPSCPGCLQGKTYIVFCYKFIFGKLIITSMLLVSEASVGQVVEVIWYYSPRCPRLLKKITHLGVHAVEVYYSPRYPCCWSILLT